MNRTCDSCDASFSTSRKIAAVVTSKLQGYEVRYKYDAMCNPCRVHNGLELNPEAIETRGYRKKLPYGDQPIRRAKRRAGTGQDNVPLKNQ